MADRNLRQLVRRRLFELDLNPEQVARRSSGSVPRETIRGLLSGRLAGPISDHLAKRLARALDVTEYRVRQAAGLPVWSYVGERTRPHLRVITGRRSS